MIFSDKTKEQPQNELTELRRRIAELEESEIDLKRSEEALRESEARYRAVVEDQTELICRWLPGGMITFVNGAYCRYFGKKPDELIMHSFMPLIPEEDHETVKKHFASIGPENPLSTHEHRVITPEGEIRWQQWSNRALFDKKGCLIEFQSVGRDITRRKRMEEELEKAHDELEQRVEERTAELLKLNMQLLQETIERKQAKEALKKRSRDLETKTRTLEDVNTTLDVLLNRVDEDKAEIEEKVLFNMKETIIPFLERLKTSPLDARQKAYVKILESNLDNIISPFSLRLSAKYSDLTSSQIQIANLISEGKTTKEIAQILNLSSRTVDAQRLRMRKKLGLSKKKADLKSHLLSLR